MSMRYRCVLLFGAPGSGKGTQGQVLGTLPGFVHIACGEVFRAIDMNSEVGRVFLQYSSKGELVPDDFTVRLWREYIEKLVRFETIKPGTDTLVLDGIPRSVRQAELMSESIDVVKLIVLRSARNREEVVRRLQSRALKDNRLDDANEETIRKRHKIYQEESKPVIDYYPTDVRVEIDALQSPIEVTHDVVSGILGRVDELFPVAES